MIEPHNGSKNIGVVSLLQNHVDDHEINNDIYLIHQEAWCAKVSSLKSVIDIMVKL